MGLKLVDLLKAIGAEINSQNPPSMPSGSLSWIGLLKNSPRALAIHGVRQGCHVWTSGPGWVPLDNIDLERWIVDAPSGPHLVVCERSSIDYDSSRFSLQKNLIIWTPSDYAKVIGEAVISEGLALASLQKTPVAANTGSRLSSKIDNNSPFFTEACPTARPASVDIHNIEENDAFIGEFVGHSGENEVGVAREGFGTDLEIAADADVSLAPLVKPHDLMEVRGRSGVALTPVMLEAKLWLVKGVLESSSKSENMEWWIIEDPFLETNEKVQPFEFLTIIPHLQIIDANKLISESQLIQILPSIVEERRAEPLDIDGNLQVDVTNEVGLHGGSHGGSHGGGGDLLLDGEVSGVGGGLLCWWKLNPDGIEIKSRRLLIPAWLAKLPIEGPTIIHGLCGKEIPY